MGAQKKLGKKTYNSWIFKGQITFYGCTRRWEKHFQISYLVGGLEHFLFFRGVGIPPTRYQTQVELFWLPLSTGSALIQLRQSNRCRPKLVSGLEHFLFFHSVGNFIIPTD